MAVSGNTLILLGGQGASDPNALYLGRISTSQGITVTWIRCATRGPNGASSYIVSVLGDKLYLFGGSLSKPMYSPLSSVLSASSTDTVAFNEVEDTLPQTFTTMQVQSVINLGDEMALIYGTTFYLYLLRSSCFIRIFI